jgi:hypothetical protein
MQITAWNTLLKDDKRIGAELETLLDSLMSQKDALMVHLFDTIERMLKVRAEELSKSVKQTKADEADDEDIRQDMVQQEYNKMIDDQQQEEENTKKLQQEYDRMMDAQQQQERQQEQQERQQEQQEQQEEKKYRSIYEQEEEKAAKRRDAKRHEKKRKRAKIVA